MTESDVPLVLARWLHFIGLMVAFGASLFPFYAMPGEPLEGFPFQAATDRIVRSCAYLALAGGLGWVMASIAFIADDACLLFERRTLGGFFFETSFGPVWILRLGLLGALAALAGTLPRGGRASTRRALIALVAACGLASQAWLGHAAMADGGKLGAELASYIVHVLAAGAWIGALVPLAMLSADQRLAGGGAGSSACSTILLRFSTVGVVLVLAILASGIANGVFRLASVHDLLATDYGYAILTKVFLFSLMVAVAAVNRWRLLPAIAADGERPLRALRRNILIEQTLAVLVLLVAAILGILPPRI